MEYSYRKNYGLKKIPVSIRVDSDIHKKILEDAKENERSFAGEISFIIRKYFDSKQKKGG